MTYIQLSLNCLSAECSIERPLGVETLDEFRTRGLNCLSTECSIESASPRTGSNTSTWSLNCLSAECSNESLAYFRPCGQGGREQNLTAGGFTNPHQKKIILVSAIFQPFLAVFSRRLTYPLRQTRQPSTIPLHKIRIPAASGVAGECPRRRMLRRSTVPMR